MQKAPTGAFSVAYTMHLRAFCSYPLNDTLMHNAPTGASQLHIQCILELLTFTS